MKGKTEIFVLIIIFLCGLSGFSLYKYAGINIDLGRQKKQLIELEARNNAITQELEEQRVRLSQVNKEKKNLEEEVTLGRQNLGQLKIELADSRKSLASLQRTVEELTAVNQNLNQEQAVLAAKIEELSSRKNTLEAKISSVEELKQMLKDLIKSKRTQRRRKARAKISTEQESKDKNHGYIIYQGKPTFKPKISIQVRPIL